MTKRKFMKELEKREQKIMEDINSKIKSKVITDIFDMQHELRFAFLEAIKSIIPSEYHSYPLDIDVVGGFPLNRYMVFIFNVKCGKFMKPFSFDVTCYTEEP